MSDKISISVGGKVTHTFKSGNRAQVKPVDEAMPKVMNGTVYVKDNAVEEYESTTVASTDEEEE